MTDEPEIPASPADPPTTLPRGHDPVVIACIRLAARRQSAPEILASLGDLGAGRDDLETVANAAVLAMQVIATDSDSVNMSDPDKLVNCLVARYIDEDLAVKIARSFPIVLREELEASRDTIPATPAPKRGGCASLTGLILLAITAVATWAAG